MGFVVYCTMGNFRYYKGDNNHTSLPCCITGFRSSGVSSGVSSGLGAAAFFGELFLWGVEGFAELKKGSF